ncbi:hypothetical protein [Streptomyces sp. AC550_RSS872]|uniref:hypothetical protein n=1 Tax=Streptomyces sp. AC550_RSS872 TaxID=2823689 RepID=UPI001C26CDA8|nr:hypothetical protein [Streptomyces sp. AC550_RSS872]
MRRARKRRRTAAVALALAVAATAVLLGGCGIQETDVIEAGGPASFQAFLDRDHDMLLFFRSPDGGLSTVIRSTQPPAEFATGGIDSGSGSGDQNLDDTAGPVPTEKVVLALLAGPREEDRAAGLTTALPSPRPGGTVKVEPSSNGRVTTHLPLALKALDNTALRQLTCTVAYSQDADGQVVVELRGQDGTSRSGTCQLAPGSTSLPETGA